MDVRVPRSELTIAEAELLLHYHVDEAIRLYLFPETDVYLAHVMRLQDLSKLFENKLRAVRDFTLNVKKAHREEAA